MEVFLYHEAEKHWNLDSMLSGQSQLTIRDGDHIYHISTMDPSSSEPNAVLDRGIWVKGQSTGEVQPVTVTGEPVDDWAANLVNEAIAKDLFPAHLKGQDLREPITRTQFAALSVRLYEAMSGQTIPAFTGTNPFTDTTDPEVLKAYSMGFTSGVSSTAFGAGTQLNREQAATMLSAVYRKLGGTIPPQEAAPFSDRGSISAWAMDSVCFAASKGVISGYEDGRFGPKDSAQRQACLICFAGTDPAAAAPPGLPRGGHAQGGRYPAHQRLRQSAGPSPPWAGSGNSDAPSALWNVPICPQARRFFSSGWTMRAN